MLERGPIYVTKTFMPPREEYDALLDSIWQSHQLTNGGELTKRFNREVSQYLGIDEAKFDFVANGTLALQLAIDALLGRSDGVSEIITTPFTYVATTSAILWQRFRPIYVDIDRQSLNIDPSKIEAAITPHTKAILAVHVYGNPCDVEAIQEIADRHNLKVIYDAAHAFGVKYKGKSILEYGDVSTLSFHATKLFHTIEGGGVYCVDSEVAGRIELSKRFGHNGDQHITLGINAKANEFQAAMGICNLRYIDDIIGRREKISKEYDKRLSGLVRRPDLADDTDYNYAYYPTLFDSQQDLERASRRLNQHNIFPRRYFFPSLNKIQYVGSSASCPVSEDAASRVLCLPLYDALCDDTVSTIIEAVR